MENCPIHKYKFVGAKKTAKTEKQKFATAKVTDPDDSTFIGSVVRITQVSEKYYGLAAIY